MNVKAITVRHLVHEELAYQVADDDYYLCLTGECGVVYYSPHLVFYRQQIKVPVWFKAGSDPKYICYCNKVTEQQIFDAVKNHNARNMKDIISLTGAMKNGKCEINNPAGKCCGTLIQQTIDRILT